MKIEGIRDGIVCYMLLKVIVRHCYSSLCHPLTGDFTESPLQTCSPITCVALFVSNNMCPYQSVIAYTTYYIADRGKL